MIQVKIFLDYRAFLNTINSTNNLLLGINHFSNFIRNNIMTASLLPSIFVPLVGIILPAFSMALFFMYIESEDIS